MRIKRRPLWASPARRDARRVARRAATSLPAAAVSRRRAGEQVLDDMIRELTNQGYTFTVYPQGNERAAVTHDPAAFFEWCRRGAWAQLGRGRVVVQPRRGGSGQKLSAWTLEASLGQTSGRKSVTAGSASAWEPSEFAAHVYPGRPPMVTMVGSKDVWIAATLLILDSSGLKFVRAGGRINGNPGQAGLALLRAWFAK